MVISVYSETNAALIERNLGESEYSYYFVLKAFLRIPEQIGRVVLAKASKLGGMYLGELSLNTVRMFYADAMGAGFKLC
jgi:hypothetical protein